MSTVFIAGCGYVGRRLAAALPASDTIYALSHSPTHQAELDALGIHPVAGDLDSDTPLDLSACANAVVYYFIPPPPAGSTDPRLPRLLAQLPRDTPPQRIVLISATGVYGDCHGDWIDESRPPAPDSDRGRRRLHAELTLRDWSATTGVAIAILRVAGIYGPGRLPRTRIEQQAPILHPQQSPYSNRIHIDDLVSACLAAAERPLDDALCNISDGHPTTMSDYFQRVADHLGLPRPPLISMQAATEQMSTGMLSYLRESRRLDNRRLREQLGVQLRYPDLASGLAGCTE